MLEKLLQMAKKHFWTDQSALHHFCVLRCWSYLGRIGGKQNISISVSGCVNHGIIEHELLHSLGFYHEHTRSDRDQYVRINWENIAPASVSNFELKDTNNLNTTYDYTSIMHYGRTSFTIQSGKATITPIPDSSVKIGQRVEMSSTDILRINKLYECGEYILCIHKNICSHYHKTHMYIKWILKI
ncbi:hatching enzyme 1.2-like [Xyrauchen texanus]|uniref:hatching enzyme 1.2-like n=1 Tax=Xyrauchen texanus TaxID=154827 RepID=UPI002242330D|nr:hatching enzyme 1.2-like [Xyrauchen texanus]